MNFRKFHDAFEGNVIPLWSDIRKRIELVQNKMDMLKNWLRILRNDNDARAIQVELEEALSNLTLLDHELTTLELEVDYLREILYDYGSAIEMEIEKLEGILGEDKGSPEDDKGE